MNLKEKWKRFWTLDVHNHEGFTLVELIIVIAILAILSTGAIAGYSVYVKQANMTADKALAAEIQNALTLYYYSNTNAGDVAYVILKADGSAVPGGFAGAAMDDAYGSSWASSLKLKYNGWKFDKSLFTAMCSINGGYASSVPGSSFITVGTDKLLGDVQNCTDNLAELLANDKLAGAGWTQENSQQLLNLYITGDENGDAMAILNGMDWSGLNEKQIGNILANATVFGIASQLNTNPEETVNKFGTGEYVLRHYSKGKDYFGVEHVALNKNSPMVLTEVANTYAALEALVGYLGNDQVKAKFDDIDISRTDANGNPKDPNKIIDSVTAACDLICDYALNDSELCDKFLAYYGLDGHEPNGKATQDGEAYLAIMQTVNGLGTDYADKDTLSAGGLFTGDSVANRVDSFLGAVGTSGGGAADLSKLPADVLSEIGNGSAIIIAFTVNSYGATGCSILFCDNQ